MRRRRTSPSHDRGERVTLEVTALGARGDGIARHKGQPAYIPFTLPGDRVTAALGAARGDGRAASLVELLSPGPGRILPACRHFGRCGGCALQHLETGLYAETKRDFVRAELSRHGLGDAPVAPLQRIAPGTRRRVRLGLARPREERAPTRLGFAERASHTLVDVAECPVLDPALFALVAPLRGLAPQILAPGESAHATIQALTSGIDLLLDLKRSPDLAGLEALAAFAAAQDLARLSWRAGSGEEPVPVAQRWPAHIDFAGIAVDVPPDAFLQATREGEAALCRGVTDAVGNSARIADLYAGLGTFTFALAQHAAVHAVEGWAPAVAALGAAAHRAGLHRITAERRDLARRPLMPEELAGYDAVVFDPPRIGAKPQSEALARSAVPRIAAVSCDPATFARDARILGDGGYRLVSVQPIDQFLWSPHVELVAAFRRG